MHLEENTESTMSRRDFIKYSGALALGFLGFSSVSESAVRQQSSDTDLEKRIEDYIQKQRKEGKIKTDEKTAWSMYDFTFDKKLVSINEETPFQAASMVKPLIALAFFHEVQNGKLQYDRTAEVKLKASIQRSNNEATNWIIDKVGGPGKIQKILKENYGGILKNVSIVEKIPQGGRTYANKASPRDYSRFLYGIWNDKLPYSEELKRLMALKKRSRIYDGTKVPQGTLTISKTGSTGRLCGDMGILVVKDRNGRDYPYTIIGIIQKDSRTDNYYQWIKSRGKIIREVSNMVYDYMKVRHKL